MPAGDAAWEALIPKSPQILEAAHSFLLIPRTHRIGIPSFPAAGNAFCQAAKLHMQLQSKHDSATSFVDAGNAYKKADPQGKAAESGIVPSRGGALLLFHKELWDAAGGQRCPGISSWCLLGFWHAAGCWDFWQLPSWCGLALGNGFLSEEWLQALWDPSCVPKALGFFQPGCDCWESLQSTFPWIGLEANPTRTHRNKLRVANTLLER